jgi:hypothetical protein
MPEMAAVEVSYLYGRALNLMGEVRGGAVYQFRYRVWESGEVEMLIDHLNRYGVRDGVGLS